MIHTCVFMRLWVVGCSASSRSSPAGFLLCQDELCLPIIPGRKSNNERFAGADETYTIEAGRIIVTRSCRLLWLIFWAVIDELCWILLKAVSVVKSRRRPEDKVGSAHVQRTQDIANLMESVWRQDERQS